MVDFENKPSYDINDLRKLISALRGPGGCPWDSEQTHESIRRNLIEEAYEAAGAIDEGDTEHLIEELGDVLMQVIFHADIAEKAGQFDLNQIADATCRKLIRRHPHVFGDVRAKDGAESLAFWDDIKRKEKQHVTTAEAMDSVARNLPALWRAEKIQQKAAKAVKAEKTDKAEIIIPDQPDDTGALPALRSVLARLEHAVACGGDIEGELGNLLFSAVHTARVYDVDPEFALGKTCDSFIAEFTRSSLD